MSGDMIFRSAPDIEWRQPPPWGPLPTAAEVEAHVAHGAHWMSRRSDGALMLFVLRAQSWGVTVRLSGGVVEREVFPDDSAAQWRPVDADGVAVERAR